MAGSHLGCAVWRGWAMVRYCLTGKCGLACGMATFHELDGTSVDLFVPEADCPIHDEVSKLLPFLDFVKCVIALARDLCETAYIASGLEAAEEAEEGFAAVLAESRPEE